MMAIDLNALLERYEKGEDLTEDEETFARRSVAVHRWLDAQQRRSARNVELGRVSLVAKGPSELEQAQAFRAKVGGQLDEVVKTINEARAKGMIISFQISQPDAFGRQSLVMLEIMKKLC